MAKTSERLSAVKVGNLKGPGYFADGNNLYFRIAPSGARGWIFRFTMRARTRDAGLGAYPGIGLATARKLAEKFRALVKEGVDPIEQRRAESAAERVAAAKSLNFDDCVREYIKAHEVGWKNAKHRAQWSSTLTTYAAPIFGKLPAAAIDTALVLRALEAIWHSKPETASRLRGRIESVLDWARVHGYRSGENPARWKGHLDHILPPRAKVQRVKHHAALPYQEVATFLGELRKREGIAPRALEFVILTAARTGDIIGNHRDEKPPMKWSHVDFAARVWTVPSTKTETEHRVPLPGSAVRLLMEMKAVAIAGDVVFGLEADKPLSNMGMASVIRRINAHRKTQRLPGFVDLKQGNRTITVHGFRSTFRDWAAERTNYPREVAEMALAHAIPNAVEAAYRRGDLFDKRRRLMDAWADYCATVSTGAVISIRA